ncbi:hypothetical protein LQD23_21510 [Chromobacterium violaceum]|uniref:hypothetical protein n=1 Tax=Chromobacterium violaceum TaxID=536 RepID=UPI001E55B72D|nr:hypothetical protein [Chromobacterium violaceum]MCD0494856.1 hypothetical protein [Chromobacterium violaceum]
MLNDIGVRNRFSGAFSFPAIQNRRRRAVQLRPAPMGRCSSTRKRPRGGYGTARRVCVFLALYAVCIFLWQYFIDRWPAKTGFLARFHLQTCLIWSIIQSI